MRWRLGSERRRPPAALPPLLPLESTAQAPVAGHVAKAADDVVIPPGDAAPVPLAIDPAPSATWDRLSEAAQGTAARFTLPGARYPIEAYDRFRRDIPIRPPPGSLPQPADGALAVLIDASVAAPFLLRATLRSLQDQSVGGWCAIVLGPATLGDHPVASFGQTDPRIAFVAIEDAVLPPAAARSVMLTAGTVLDPEALAWLLFAADRTDAPVVFADHDDGVADPALGLVRTDPWLPGVLDLPALSYGSAPAMVLADRASLADALDGVSVDGGDALRLAVLRGGLATGAVPHVARLLATRLHLPVVARKGRDSDDDGVPGRLGPIPLDTPRPQPAPHRPDRIAIVIPTRDGAALLARAIDSLRRAARDESRLDILVVDNRSGDDATQALLDRLSSDGRARIVRFDAPFNWSQASNAGAAESDAPVIVFANNDIEMTADGWDDLLLEQLSDATVGAVGARLLYPDRTVQHAGVAFGFGPGGAEHEGRGRAVDDPGPDRRFVTTHAVASVTGAFLAVRRSDFDAIGGFDEGRLMIAHSDVDLCLRLRENGLIVRYCAEIVALHHEGATRGRNETRAAIAWDEGERADLIDRWGEELGNDPSINPYWTRGGQPFDGLSEPSMRTVLRHLDASARRDPWRPIRRVERETAAWLPELLT